MNMNEAGQPSAPSAPGSAPLKLIVPPRLDDALPKVFASDALTGGTFKARREALEQLCDQIFGADRPWQLHSDEVLVDWGELTAPPKPPATVEQATAPEPQSLPCSFLCFRVLIAPRESPKDVRMVVTHLFVDHVWAMIYARELFGFPALFAKFTPIVEDERRGVEVTVDGDNPYQQQVVARLLWVNSRDALSADSFWQMILANPAKPELRGAPFVQVKQMRDGLDASRACYQASIEGQVRVDAPKLEVSAAQLTLRLPQELLLEAADVGLEREAKSTRGYRASATTFSVGVQSPPQEPIIRNGRSGRPFRQWSGDVQAAPPYSFTNVEIVGFRLPVAAHLLTKLCDTWLNAPFPDRSYRYVPANVDLVVEYLHYPSMKSANPAFRRSVDDATSQQELVFRILVGRVDDDGRPIRSPAVFCPFVFVNSIWSMVSGREVMGYPKLLASFNDYPRQGQGFDACHINAVTPTAGGERERHLLTMDCRFDRDPRDVEELFESSRKETGTRIAAPSGTPMDPDFAWWGLADLQSGGANLDTFSAPWLNGQRYGYAGVQLKRFSDAKKPSGECYHEVVECDYTLLKAAVSLQLHNATLHFPEEDVYGIAATFGFPAIVPVPPGAWYRTTADFALNIVDPLA